MRSIEVLLIELIDAQDSVTHFLMRGPRQACTAAQDKRDAIEVEIVADFERMRKERDLVRATSAELRKMADAAVEVAVIFNRDLNNKAAWSAAWKLKAKEYRKRHSDLCDEVEQLMWDSVGG